MKARISPKDRISNKNKKILDEYMSDCQKDIMRRYFKILCVTLNEEFGFGAERLLKVVDKIDKVCSEHINDEEYWYHIDKRVIEQIKVPFEYENYKEL